MSAIPDVPSTGPAARRTAGRSRTEDPAPHVEIVSTRAQRRARPRLLAALGTVGGLFAILTAQLLLTIATSEGAYEIAALQSAQNELARDEQVLVEKIRILEAPQHLAAEAQGMGMVPSTSAAQLRLTDATVLGTPTAASATAALMTAPDGTPLIPNSLLAEVPLVGAAALAASGEAVPSAGAPPAVPADGSVASVQPIGIPTPNTH